jgi:hypothetical protein
MGVYKVQSDVITTWSMHCISIDSETERHSVKYYHVQWADHLAHPRHQVPNNHVAPSI